MELINIKKIAQELQRDDKWIVATVIKLKSEEIAVYYCENLGDLLEHDAYIVLDILERGSVPVKEIAIYFKEPECLDHISAYLRKALVAMNKENYDAIMLMLRSDKTVCSRRIRDI